MNWFQTSCFYILTILYEGSVHGYGIISRFKKRVQKKNKSQLGLSVSSTPRRKRLGEAHETTNWRKKRKVFELTKKGRELCIGLFKRFVNLVSPAIEPNLYVCAPCDCKVYGGAYREVIAGKE